MRQPSRLTGRTDRVPFGDEGCFRLFAVQAQLAALLAFHVLLRVLALQQHRGIADSIIELRGVAYRFGVAQLAGLGATGEHGFVEGGPGVGAGGIGDAGQGGYVGGAAALIAIEDYLRLAGLGEAVRIDTNSSSLTASLTCTLCSR